MKKVFDINILRPTSFLAFNEKERKEESKETELVTFDCFVRNESEVFQELKALKEIIVRN